ncbi:alkaline phosphatase [Pseudonocardiaceae bacterium YIM PH 21723]|nr:alkaline phosphatase [Pseudonocardiaceae bacterium YIM PH 21723]
MMRGIRTLPPHQEPAMSRRRTLLTVATLSAAGLAAVMALSGSAAVGAADPNDAVLIGAGDIAQCKSADPNGNGAALTAAKTHELLAANPGATVFTAGDNAYPDGSADDFQKCYEPTWGDFKDRTLPVAGNHEYHTKGAAGHYGYFGAKAGDPDKGYYSTDLGSWHVIVLNSNCDDVSCKAGGPQEKWLRADLASHTAKCTVALWHHPLFTSGLPHGPETAVRPLYQALYDANADLVITGHNHVYERFAPQDPKGKLDESRGLRQFVVGTGGASWYRFGLIKKNSEARSSTTWGVIKLTLKPGSYDWEYAHAGGVQKFEDSGSTNCH